MPKIAELPGDSPVDPYQWLCPWTPSGPFSGSLDPTPQNRSQVLDSDAFGVTLSVKLDPPKKYNKNILATPVPARPTHSAHLDPSRYLLACKTNNDNTVT